MSRFVLIADGGLEEVIEVPTVADAKCQAVRFAGQLICDRAERFWDTAEFNMTVRDSEGLVLFTLQFVGTEAPALRGRSH